MRASLVEDAARAGTGTVFCRSCRFCTTVCPAGVRIPEVMTMINLSVAAGSADVRAGDLLRHAYEARTAGGPASARVRRPLSSRHSHHLANGPRNPALRALIAPVWCR
jgi:Fe-S oxidoreductase